MLGVVAMTAYGRKRTLNFIDFGLSERPLLGKADIQRTRLKFAAASGCSTPKPAAQVLEFGAY